MDQQVGQNEPDAQHAVEQSPNDYHNLRERGLALLRSRKFAEAAEEFRAAIPEHPKSSELPILLSIALQHLGKIDEAISAAEEAARMDDTRCARLGELYLTGGRPADAQAAFEKAIAAGHGTAHTHHLLSIAFERQGNSTEALSSARRSLDLEPDDSRWKEWLASLTERAETAAVRAEIELAQTAARRGDWEESVRVWERVRAMAPNLATGYSSASEALRHVRRYPEAADLIEDAIRLFPDDGGVAVEYARVASEQKDWDEARSRWDCVISRYPDRSVGYLGKLALLRATGQFAEAESLCVTTIQRFPDEHAPLIEHASLAQSSGAWAQAVRRWDKVREVAPHHLFPYTSTAVAYWEQQQFDDAEVVLKDAMQRFPEQPSPFMHFAELATRQNDWGEALRRWKYVTEHFSKDPNHLIHVHRMETARMRLLEIDPVAAEALSGKASTPGAGDDGLGSEPDMREVMLAFESMGGQMGGCEFGNVQRAFGAEPLSLLRWAELSPEQLILALTLKFEGVGEPEQTEVVLKNNGGRNEYQTLDRRFGMAMHTFIHEDEISHEKMYTQSCRRLKYLAGKLLDDLHAGRKIFVYKIASRDLTDDELDRLYAAIRAYGDTMLLYVRTETETKTNGTVELVKPGLMIGYIDQFSVYREGGRLSDQSASWAPICLNAFRLWQHGKTSDQLDVALSQPSEAHDKQSMPDNEIAPVEPINHDSEEPTPYVAPASRAPDRPAAPSGRGLASRIRSLFSAGSRDRR